MKIRSQDEIAKSHQKSQFGGSGEQVNTLIRDGRGLGLKLDQHSFQLSQQVTTLSTQDFYNNPGKITSVYYKEIQNLMKQATGAKEVVCIHHQVRCEAKMGSNNDPKKPIQGYAGAVHGDSHPHSAEKIWKSLVGHKPIL